MDRTLLSLLSGLGGMFGWGISDFFANQASEKVGSRKAFFWSQIAGVGLIAITLLFFFKAVSITVPLLIITILSGIAYAFGYLLFYRGFEIGNISVVSAVINLQILFVMLIAFFMFGQRLTALQFGALSLVILGIFLVSVNFNQLKSGAVSLMVGVKETLLAALIFGVLYWPVNEYIVERSHWLLIAFITKITALIVVFLLSKKQKMDLSIQLQPQKMKVMIVVIGILEAAAMMSVTFGLSYGDSIIVAPISSALSIVTIGLAIVFLKEKISKVQFLGIVLTIGGIILTAL